MTSLTHDAAAQAARTGAGLVLAVVSALSFGLSGALGKGLSESGWSAGASVTARIGIGAAVLAVPTLLALRGQWKLLRHGAGPLLVYGVVAVAGCQLSYFYAIERLEVSVALLIEYTAPVAVVVWMWLRHGHRPVALTVAGAGVAACGLALVLDIGSGASLDVVGVLWALGAMAGVATYFVMSADEGTGLPPLVLAGGGLVVGTVVLCLAGLVGIVPMTAGTTPVTFATGAVPWWVPVLGLGVVTAAVAYTTGVAAGRRLGSRVASFVGLLEVVAAILFALLLLNEVPAIVQLVGGVLILAGVVLVRSGERLVRGRGGAALSPAAPAARPAAPG